MWFFFWSNTEMFQLTCQWFYNHENAKQKLPVVHVCRFPPKLTVLLELVLVQGLLLGAETIELLLSLLQGHLCAQQPQTLPHRFLPLFFPHSWPQWIWFFQSSRKMRSNQVILLGPTISSQSDHIYWQSITWPKFQAQGPITLQTVKQLNKNRPRTSTFSYDLPQLRKVFILFEKSQPAYFTVCRIIKAMTISGA